jgi:lysosomal acid lipase/cholesteryl ester hydrolase
MKYILSKTNQKSLVFICHSLGCGLFFIAMIEHPELNNSVDVMIALGPTSSVAHLGGATRLAANLMPVRHMLLRSARNQKRAFLANSGSLSQRMQRAICDRTLLGSMLCRNYIFSIFGTNSNNFNMVKWLYKKTNIFMNKKLFIVSLTLIHVQHLK